MISFDDLALFARVANKQSFAGAAKQVGISTSTVSRRIAQLEEQLGAQLLYRTSRNITLTPAGKVYLDRCSPGLTALSEAIENFDSDDSALRGMLRVTCPAFLGHAWLGPWIVDFLQSHPDLTLDLRLSNSLLDLVEEGIDVAFRLGPLETSALIARKLWTVSYVLCAHERIAGHAEQRIAGEGLAALRELPCVVTSSRVSWRFVRDGGISKWVSPRPVIEVDDLRIAGHAARQGLGIGCMPTLLMDETMGEARALDLGPWRLASRTVYAVYPPSRQLSAKVQGLVGYVAERWQEFRRSSRPA